MIKIFFITGAEGVGKSTLIKVLKNKLKKTKIYDFDEVGVPINPPLSWRYKTTKHWLKVANKNNKDTMVIGLSFPKEILRFSNSKENLYFCLLDINIKEREKRLKKRGAQKEVIKDLKELKNLREQFKHLKHFKKINVSNLKPNEIANKIFDWIKNN